MDGKSIGSLETILARFILVGGCYVPTEMKNVALSEFFNSGEDYSFFEIESR
jgi:hypothetical protein